MYLSEREKDGVSRDRRTQTLDRVVSDALESVDNLFLLGDRAPELHMLSRMWANSMINQFTAIELKALEEGENGISLVTDEIITYINDTIDPERYIPGQEISETPGEFSPLEFDVRKRLFITADIIKFYILENPAIKADIEKKLEGTPLLDHYMRIAELAQLQKED